MIGCPGTIPATMSAVIVALYIGRGTLINALIRRWQRSPYSHCEVVTRRLPRTGPSPADQLFECWSASGRDGGVRRKIMPLEPARWELYRLPSASPEAARDWFEARNGDGYDLFGLLGFAWRPWRGRRNAWWCSEACAAALGLSEPWRYDVATFASVVKRLGMRITS